MTDADGQRAHIGGLEAGVASEGQETLVALGQRIRELRASQSKTLQSLADAAGLSPSMLSLVERGKASPSLGSLVSICAALGVHMSELFGKGDNGSNRAVIRRLEDQPHFQTAKGVLRRVVQSDPKTRVELVVNQIDPHTATHTRTRPHAGYEFGLVLEGAITVEFDATSYELATGDSIRYESTIPHRLANNGEEPATVVWVNLYS
jgi:transcriptional regulator with XRE-family HTH domain